MMSSVPTAVACPTWSRALALAAVTTRLRAKSQDVHGLLNFVLSIFDQGSIPLPQSDQLRSLPPAAAAGAAPNAAAKRPKEGAAAN